MRIFDLRTCILVVIAISGVKWTEYHYDYALTQKDSEILSLKLDLFEATHDPPPIEEVEITAYVPTGRKPALSISKTVPGKTIAVSRDLQYLLGKWVYVEGYGVRYVNDLMAKRWTKRIDILVGTKKEALKIGLQKGRVTWLEF